MHCCMCRNMSPGPVRRGRVRAKADDDAGLHQLRRRAAAEDRGDRARIVGDAGIRVSAQMRISSGRQVGGVRQQRRPARGSPAHARSATLPAAMAVLREDEAAFARERMDLACAWRCASPIGRRVHGCAMLRAQGRRQQRDGEPLPVRPVPAVDQGPAGLHLRARR